MSKDIQQANIGSSSYIKGAIIGGIIGAAAALLLAPKSGRELRQDLRDKCGEAGEAVKTAACAVSETAGNAVQSVSQQASNIKEKVQHLSNNARQHAADAAEAAADTVSKAADKVREVTDIAANEEDRTNS
ncbi:YtxH domain-containing protein [Paenibacillus sp. GCM10012307]|uniref:YtxH domain-containing protein n=2 Tax=Paenibacillus roseus TaxID=2798579 RepID=A0A934J6M1_9BACL|nr:YtxH domain-containing protein [Paenibacillus roseus]